MSNKQKQKFSINGRVYYKDGHERDIVISIKAEDKAEAQFFFSHGVHINNSPVDAQVKLDFRTLKQEIKRK